KEVSFRLEDVTTGKLIINDIPPYIFKQIQEVLKSDGIKKIDIVDKQAKAVRLSNSNYIAHAFTFDKNYIKSQRLIRSEVEIMLASAENIDEEIQRIKDRAESQSKRLIHNLKSLSAKISQEIFYVALQSNLMASHKDSLEYLENKLLEKPKEAAKALLTILKYSTAQNTEFAAFQKLNGDVGQLKKEPHKIHKILMSVFYLFFPDFTDKHVRITVGKSDHEGVFDYDSIHVCIYHLIENAAKYIKPGGDFNVYISRSSNELNIVFDMESLSIYDDEVEKIFTEGFSGKNAKTSVLNGNGIGLFLAKRMAIINDGNLVVVNGKPQQLDPRYARNKFTLTLMA
ncbi:MAG: ATP-binding protein, partial [Burkholderiales bacterium]